MGLRRHATSSQAYSRRQMNTSASISLSCLHSPCPGSDWDAWIGFRVTKKGFSLLAKYSDDGKGRPWKVSESSQPCNWRHGIDTMRASPELLLDGDFRRSIIVEGIDGLGAEMLTLAWHTGDFEYETAFLFLLGLPDSDLKQIYSEEGGLLANVTLDKVADLVRITGWYAPSEVKPLDSIAREYGSSKGAKSFQQVVDLARNFDLANEQLANAAKHYRVKHRAALLAPFAEDLQTIQQALTAGWPEASGYASGIGQMMRRGKIKMALENFVIAKARLPTQAEIATLFS